MYFASALANPYALESSMAATTAVLHAAGTRSDRQMMSAGTNTNVR